MIEDIKKAKFNILLSEEDKTWIFDEYPSLTITKSRLYGEICFQRTDNNITILECYNIEVSLKYNEKSMLPKVRCIDRKIENIAAYLNKKLDDLHINSDNSFCLTIYPKEKDFFSDKEFNIREFFKNLVEPFLYWISYYERFNEAPWADYAHGYLGIIEYIGENEDIVFEEVFNILKSENVSLRKILRVYRQSTCLCGSNLKMRKCHNRIWNGIKKSKN